MAYFLWTSLTLAVILSLHLIASQEDDEGFNKLFESNLQEMNDVPVTFKEPLPAWMNGILIRNGMGQFENGARSFVHTFDGFAKLASWKFHGNTTKALFSTKFVRSQFYNLSMEDNTIAPFLLFMSTIPPYSAYERAIALYRGIDNMNINVYKFPNNGTTKSPDFAALSDYWLAYKVDINTLSTIEKVQPQLIEPSESRYSGRYKRSLTYMNLLSTAHPLPEPATSNIITFLTSVAVVPGESSYMKVIRSRSLHHRELIAEWPISKLPYMHSFSMTASKAILLAAPFYSDIDCMAMKGEPFKCMDWFPHENSTFYVINTKTGKVTSIQTPCLFSMHHANAYDESPTSLIMDLSTYESPELVSDLTLDVLKNATKRNNIKTMPLLKRFRVDLEKNTVTEVPIDVGATKISTYLDFPVINEKFRSSHYCWLWGVVPKADNATFSKAAIVKKDLCGHGKEDKMWQVPHHYPGEAWFVARPDGKSEDDGVLLVPVLDGPRGVSYLAMLDAQTMTLINQADTPTYIPYNLHGRYFD